MPTGYTTNIQDMSFEQFAMGCARAFGALITMRDEPADTPIPESFDPSDFHQKSIENLKQELQTLEAMPAKDIEKQCYEDWERKESSRMQGLLDCRALRASYEEMLSKAKSWTPPSSDHQGLKDFMIEQITKSIDFDCEESYYETPTERIKPNLWLLQQKQKIKRNIEYHEKAHQEEVARVNSRNEWVSALRESL